MLFKDVIGQQPVKHRLINQVKEGRISHAQLFLGPEGCGNLALAIAYAQYIFCTNKQTDDACGVCASCQKVKKLSHPDLHFTYPTVGGKAISTSFMAEWRTAIEQNAYLNVNDWIGMLKNENSQGNITTEECGEIIKKLSLKSFEGGYKIQIIWMPEYLGNAGNVLLKIVEEPPAFTVFLLVATNASQIIGTIMSRTQLIKTPALSASEIAQALVQREGLGTKQAETIAQMSEGNYNTALTLMSSNEEEQKLSEEFIQWMRNCYSYGKAAVQLINWVEAMPKRWGREDQKRFLVFGMHIIRQCLLIGYAHPSLVGLFDKELDDYKRMAILIKHENGAQMYEELNLACLHIERNGNGKIVFLDLSLKMAKLLHNRM